jgi:4-amino-4-deoxy-L-arabinose transferase-like glycosyltransferase
MRRCRRLPAVLWLLLAVIAAGVPFLNQAFHMDDGIYLMIARNVHLKPWFPQDMPLFFEGLYGSDLASTEHPWPLTSYLLALCSYLGGHSERCLHMGFLVFPMLVAGSMYSISLGLTRHPVLATLTLLACPVVSVLSHTLMTDIPLLAIWLFSVALFRRGLTTGRIAWAWIGAVAGALALLITYSGFLLIVLLSVFSLLRRNRRALLASFAAPVIILSFWITLNYLHYHRLAPAMLVDSYLSVKNVLAPGLVAEKLIFAVLALGATTVSPVIVLAQGKKGVIWGGLAGTLFAGLIPQISKFSPAQVVLFLAFFWAGFTMLLCVAEGWIRSIAGLRIARKEVAEDFFLGCWFFGVVLFCVLVYMTGSARFLLPALPPLILILFRILEQSRVESKARRIAVSNLVFCTLAGLSLAVADYQFASIYRSFASTIAGSYSAGKQNLWFTGEWGLRAYLERCGGQELGRRDGRARPGDLLVVPSLATPYRTLYGDSLDLQSIVMVSPSSVTFDIPEIPRDSALTCTIGMPFYASSDGMEFTVRFVSLEGERTLHHERILPSAGRRWRIQRIPLAEIAGKKGSVVLVAGVGSTGNAEADWVAISRARIGLISEDREMVLYDFLDHLKQERIEPVAGVDYHTDRNLPVFLMTVWLDQEPAVILRLRSEYRPRFALRLLDSRTNAGFWSSSWGLLPFSFATGKEALESISVYEVTRQVDAYGESTPSWYER